MSSGVAAAPFPSFSRSIPTVLRRDQKQKETASVLCLLKIKELLAQFLDRGGCAINKMPRSILSRADGVVNKFKQNKVRFAIIYKEAARPITNHPVLAF
jgi:hypothetical protein